MNNFSESTSFGEDIIRKHKNFDTFDFGSVMLVFLEPIKNEEVEENPITLENIQVIIRLLLQYNNGIFSKNNKFSSTMLSRNYIEKTMDNYFVSLKIQSPNEYKKYISLKNEINEIINAKTQNKFIKGKKHKQISKGIKEKHKNVSERLWTEMTEIEAKKKTLIKSTSLQRENIEKISTVNMLKNSLQNNVWVSRNIKEFNTITNKTNEVREQQTNIKELIKKISSLSKEEQNVIWEKADLNFVIKKSELVTSSSEITEIQEVITNLNKLNGVDYQDFKKQFIENTTLSSVKLEKFNSESIRLEKNRFLKLLKESKAVEHSAILNLLQKENLTHISSSKIVKGKEWENIQKIVRNSTEQEFSKVLKILNQVELSEREFASAKTKENHTDLNKNSFAIKYSKFIEKNLLLEKKRLIAMLNSEIVKKTNLFSEKSHELTGKKDQAYKKSQESVSEFLYKNVIWSKENVSLINSVLTELADKKTISTEFVKNINTHHLDKSVQIEEKDINKTGIILHHENKYKMDTIEESSELSTVNKIKETQVQIKNQNLYLKSTDVHHVIENVRSEERNIINEGILLYNKNKQKKDATEETSAISIINKIKKNQLQIKELSLKNQNNTNLYKSELFAMMELYKKDQNEVFVKNLMKKQSIAEKNLIRLQTEENIFKEEINRTAENEVNLYRKNKVNKDTIYENLWENLIQKTERKTVAGQQMEESDRAAISRRENSFRIIENIEKNFLQIQNENYKKSKMQFAENVMLLREYNKTMKSRLNLYERINRREDRLQRNSIEEQLEKIKNQQFRIERFSMFHIKKADSQGKSVFINKLYKKKLVKELIAEDQQIKYSFLKKQDTEILSETNLFKQVSTTKENSERNEKNIQKNVIKNQENILELTHVRKQNSETVNELDKQKILVKDLSEKIELQKEIVEQISKKNVKTENTVIDKNKPRIQQAKTRISDEDIAMIKRDIMNTFQKEIRLEKQRRGL